jgi:phosphinothricin acetyltransferase
MRDADIRPSGPGDIAAITRIYADAVAHGTATFEIEPPDEAETARRQLALLANGFPYLVAEQAGATRVMPMPAITTPGRPTAGPSRIRSISPRPSSAGA